MKTKHLKKIIIIIIVIIFLLMIIRQIFRIPIGINSKQLKQELALTGTELIKIEKSSERNYKNDVYVNFGESSVEDETSNEQYFQYVLTKINPILKKQSTRIIDNKKNMIIRCKFNQDGIIKYIVNNDPYYFKNIIGLTQISKPLDEKELINPVIKSQELIDLLNNNWNRRTSISIGKITSSAQNVDYYNNNGYKIKMIGNQVASITFTKEYQKEVFQGIYPGMPIEKFPYHNIETTSNDIAIQGFESDQYIAFYYNEEITVTRKKTYDENKNKEFVQAVNKLLENKNYNEFYKKAIEIYPDFYIKRIDKDSLYISFPLEGFEIKYNYESPSYGKKETGICIYSNYKGKVYLDKTLQDIIKENHIMTDQIKLQRGTSNELFLFDIQEI